MCKYNTKKNPERQTVFCSVHNIAISKVVVALENNTQALPLKSGNMTEIPVQ